MELWSAEVEAMREEARTVVAAGFDALRSRVPEVAGDAGDPIERAQARRKLFEATYVTVPAAEARVIAGVRCRVFVPEDGPARAVYLHFHGGGMIVGAPQMNDVGNLDTCRRHNVAVVSVDYRLAPEHPHPAGPDDGMAVVRWLLENGSAEFGSERLLLGGESAGGYMAAVVMLRMRDELDAVDRVDGVNLVFGVYDWGRSPSQRGLRAHDGPDILDPAAIEFFSECYLPGMTDDERRAPSISPAFADLHGLPPALMSVGGCDHLLDDTLILASRWAAAGNPVELFVAPDMPHGFMAFPCGITARWADVTRAWFETRLGG